jgi:hypothetical protein
MSIQASHTISKTSDLLSNQVLLERGLLEEREVQFQLREKLDTLYDQYLNLLNFEEPFGELNT